MSGQHIYAKYYLAEISTQRYKKEVFLCPEHPYQFNNDGTVTDPNSLDSPLIKVDESGMGVLVDKSTFYTQVLEEVPMRDVLKYLQGL